MISIGSVMNVGMSGNSKIMIIHQYNFTHICLIEPEVDDLGTVKKYMPQSRYYKSEFIPLNKQGKGPFCKFRIDKSLQIEGVYIIRSNDEPVYVGECVNLSKRFNMGYGQISPKNCFKNGQSTNCKVNNFILKESLKGSTIEMLFYETEKRNIIETDLIYKLNPIWNY